ncbi:MAG: thiamine phosphate synthase [Asticcacaulis sp.]
MSQPECRLYLITPPRVDDADAFVAALKAALSGGDVAALQIRLKDHDEAEIRALTARIAPVAQAAGVAVLMNDRPELVRPLKLDGVHIGQTDMPLKQARSLLGSDAMIGVTCHDSRHLAMEAAEAGADYVAFGAFFETNTKDASTRADPAILTIWQESMEIPCVAIGGITVDKARDLARAGADFLAVSQGVWGHPDGPAAAVAAFNHEMQAGVAERPGA